MGGGKLGEDLLLAAVRHSRRRRVRVIVMVKPSLDRYARMRQSLAPIKADAFASRRGAEKAVA